MDRKALVPLGGARLEAVERAFAALDTDRTGRIPLEQVLAAYDPLKHPRVVEGMMSQSKAMDVLRDQLSPRASQLDGNVDWDAFLTLHTKISAEIDRSREKDKTATFVDIVARTWRLHGDGLGSTHIVPVTLEKPQGLAATRFMDLIWVDDATGETVGYRGVVKASFARKDLSADLQPHVAMKEETSELHVRYLPAQPAVQPPYDIVWKNEAGEVVGYRGVVAANIEPALLPSMLRSAVVSTKTAASMGVRYLPSTDVVNPSYKKSSQSIGVGAADAATRVTDLKQKAHEGALCGHVFAGRAGAFTKTFAGGMPTTSGMNI